MLVIADGDTSCANPVFNAGIAAECNAFLADAPGACDACSASGARCDECATAQGQCSECELARVTEELKALAKQYNAGEVAVQPRLRALDARRAGELPGRGHRPAPAAPSPSRSTPTNLRP